MPPPDSSAGQLNAMWRRQLVWWHAFFAVLIVTTVVVLVAEHHAHLAWELACVAAIAVAYAVWGRHAIGAQSPRAGIAYIAVAWGAMVVLMALDGTGTAWVLTF